MSNVRPPESLLRKISKLFLPLWGIRAGLYLTLQHIFKRKFTVQYPEQRIEIDTNFRGKVTLLNRGTIEDSICNCCRKCEAICPVDCIRVVPLAGEDKKKRPLIYDVDMNKCLYCNLCEEVCPEHCVVLDPVYDYSSYSHDGLYFTIKGVSRPATAAELEEIRLFHEAEEGEKVRQRELRKKEAEAKKMAGAATGGAENKKENAEGE